MKLTELVGTELPIIQAPMAGAQGSAMTLAVCNAGALGSLPCAMLSPQGMREELAAIKAKTGRPFNVNFFCHTPPKPDPEREAAWRAALTPYYKQYGIDPGSIPSEAGRVPFTAEFADVFERVQTGVGELPFRFAGRRSGGSRQVVGIESNRLAQRQ